MSSRARRRLLKSLRLRAVVRAGFDGLLDDCDTVEAFNRELREACRDLAEGSAADHRGPPLFDPLSDDLCDLRPDDESRAEWLEIRAEFAGAEEAIEHARALLPRLKTPRRFRGDYTEFPARIHQTARALLHRTGVVLQYGPRNYGRTWADAARIVPQVSDQASDSEVLACLAIATAREAGEALAALDAGRAGARNDAILIEWKSRLDTARGALRDAEHFAELAELAQEKEEENRRNEADRRRERTEKGRQRGGLKAGPMKRKEKAAALGAAILAIAKEANTWEAKILRKRIEALAELQKQVSGVTFTETTESECYWETTSENGGHSDSFKWDSFPAMRTTIKKKSADF